MLEEGEFALVSSRNLPTDFLPPFFCLHIVLFLLSRSPGCLIMNCSNNISFTATAITVFGSTTISRRVSQAHVRPSATSPSATKARNSTSWVSSFGMLVRSKTDELVKRHFGEFWGDVASEAFKRAGGPVFLHLIYHSASAGEEYQNTRTEEDMTPDGCLLSN